VRPVYPWRIAFCEERAAPASLVGPWECCAFSRFAFICAWVAMDVCGSFTRLEHCVRRRKRRVGRCAIFDGRCIYLCGLRGFLKRCDSAAEALRFSGRRVSRGSPLQGIGVKIRNGIFFDCSVVLNSCSHCRFTKRSGSMCGRCCPPISTSRLAG
jgi:hypothetical protein